MNEKGEKGRLAENIALDFLLERGLVLLDRNWRCGHKELDLVMKSSTGLRESYLLHIIEVRSLTEPCSQMPFETIGYKKQRSVITAASGYIRVHRIDFETRFDVISVIFKPEGDYRLEYFPDAFTPVW